MITLKVLFVINSPTEGYREITMKHTKEDWIFAQIPASKVGISGQPEYFDLIFAKKTTYNKKRASLMLALYV